MISKSGKKWSRAPESRSKGNDLDLGTRYRKQNAMNNIALDDPLASFRLDDRLVVVTGASEGIGRVFAESFARAGASLVLVSRRPEKLEEVRRAIADHGGDATAVPADVREIATIRAVAETVRRLMQGDKRKLVLVNNAGFGFTKPALEVTEQDWNTLFETHAKGAFFCSQQIGSLMIERGYGKIINMSSTWSVATQSGKSVYGAAKAAVSHLTAALSTEWAPHGVRVNALAPATTTTDSANDRILKDPARFEQIRGRIKLGEFAKPSDLVGAAIYLASGASDFVTGQTLFIDGGFTT
jgi:NAD(P)-dependent dehydrogenase (short-subunit alcohol dehydrogenase family)